MAARRLSTASPITAIRTSRSSRRTSCWTRGSLLPQTPDDWQRDRAFAEFLRVRDVACECDDPYASVTTIQASSTAAVPRARASTASIAPCRTFKISGRSLRGRGAAPAETADADAEEAETGRLGELEAKVRALEIANATLETKKPQGGDRARRRPGHDCHVPAPQDRERGRGALVEWNVPTKDIPDEDAPFYYVRLAPAATVLLRTPTPGNRHDDREGIHWILNQARRRSARAANTSR